MYRSVKNELLYAKDRNGSNKYGDDSSICLFCFIEKEEPERIVDKNTSVRVIKNMYPYDQWDYFKVSDHLMIVPKRHVEGLHQLTKSERNDYWEMMSKYEAKMYNFYARTGGNKSKSVYHQHGHLIKTYGYPTRLMLFIKKPHFRIYK